MRGWPLLALLGVLAACGGGVATLPPAPTPQAPPAPASSPQVPASGPAGATPPAPAASAPQVPPVAPLPVTWGRVLWEEPWEALALGGWVRHSGLACRGSNTDPDLAPEAYYVSPGARWSVHGSVLGTLALRGGTLYVDSPQSAGGYALLSSRTFPVDKPLAVQATVDLQPDNGAWLGLALIADETDYRELALYTDFDVPHRVSAGVWHPCTVEWKVGTWAPGPRVLRLEYTPAGPICWKHYVDDVLVAAERCDVPGAPLKNPARAGLYIVNLLAEGQRVPGYVRASVSKIQVYTEE